ncbi:MAG: DUF4276 family protein [Gammaproteobacteria bacterium]|nr:DUF4276 family protein [Gammaproteobacteria bacterium]
MIVFLTEEESMAATLDTVMAVNWTHAINGVDWISLSFQGKSDLEKNISLKMQQWNYSDPHFVILRDQDGADCTVVKERLNQKAKEGNKPYSIRIVCQELESWFLGELDAVEAAYPHINAGKLRNKAKFRKPDDLTNASQELEKLVDVKGKVGRAKAIAEHFQPPRCVAHSFSVFWKKIATLMDKESP